MAKRKKIIKDKKLRGEWAEMQFMARAAEHGLSVSKPWGEMRPYDFVVGKTGRFISVQVKSTVHECKTGYDCTVRGGHKSYPTGSFDFVAAYAVPVDVWYIIPAAAIRGKKSVTLFPNSKTARYEKYREAWHLLRQAAELSEDGEGCGEETPAARSGETSTDETQAMKTERRPPANALGRMEASLNFFRRQLERGRVISEKDDDV
jgi:hypothetical protein